LFREGLPEESAGVRRRHEPHDPRTFQHPLEHGGVAAGVFPGVVEFFETRRQAGSPADPGADGLGWRGKIELSVLSVSRDPWRLRRAVYRHLYRDRNPDPGASIVVAGSARSGTTWVGDLLAEAARARVVFEPFHHELVPEFGPLGAFPYRRPADLDPELEAFCRRMLAGSLRGAWIDREVERLRTSRRVVKVVRGNLFLAWLARSFPQVPVVLVLRHPCAVVASRMALDWNPRPDLDALLAQTRLLEDHLTNFRELIAGATTEEARNAVVWCLHYLVPLRQYEPGAYTAVFYESLCARPEIELPRLLSAVGGDLCELPASRTLVPSTTSRLGSAAVTGDDRITSWQRSLDAGTIERILEVVRAFGLDSIYDESPMPRSDPFSSSSNPFRNAR